MPEALREFASRSGALPAEEGYPADLASAIAAFYERAGRVQTLGGDTGSVTIIGAVSPAGGDLSEPVTSITQRFVRSLWSLDRDLAYSRHYPAVAWDGSFSRDAPALGVWHTRAGDPAWASRRARLMALLAEADRLAPVADLVGVTSLPGYERVVLLGSTLVRQAVLQQSALSAHDAFCSPAKAAALADMVLDVVDAAQGAIVRGAPAATLEELDFTPMLRARELVGPDETAEIVAVRDRLCSALERLP